MGGFGKKFWRSTDDPCINYWRACGSWNGEWKRNTTWQPFSSKSTDRSAYWVSGKGLKQARRAIFGGWTLSWSTKKYSDNNGWKIGQVRVEGNKIGDVPSFWHNRNKRMKGTNIPFQPLSTLAHFLVSPFNPV